MIKIDPAIGVARISEKRVIYDGIEPTTYRIWNASDSDSPMLRVIGGTAEYQLTPGNSIDITAKRITVMPDAGSPVCAYQWIHAS